MHACKGLCVAFLTESTSVRYLLANSAGSVMQLLNHVGVGREDGSVKDLMLRLWPYFRHPMTPVRLAAVRLFAKVVASQASGGGSTSWSPKSCMVLALLFQAQSTSLMSDVLT